MLKKALGSALVSMLLVACGTDSSGDDNPAVTPPADSPSAEDSAGIKLDLVNSYCEFTKTDPKDFVVSCPTEVASLSYDMFTGRSLNLQGVNLNGKVVDLQVTVDATDATRVTGSLQTEEIAIEINLADGRSEVLSYFSM